jgi:hypothetical protein
VFFQIQILSCVPLELWRGLSGADLARKTAIGERWMLCHGPYEENTVSYHSEDIFGRIQVTPTREVRIASLMSDSGIHTRRTVR